MSIEKELTAGCDRASRVYGNMFNVLEEAMHDEEKLKELSPVDFSALGMYIGKFVEQEINSSVVQIMRAFRGVPMPEYYCKRYDRYIKPVITKKQEIYLNSWIDRGHPDTLKTIPLGDAYYALAQLKKEDYREFFKSYPWLDESPFLDAWYMLSQFRNRMAHIGEIINAEILRDNYEYFMTFLSYMPDITKTKRELAPKGYRQSLMSTRKTKTDRTNNIRTGYLAEKIVAENLAAEEINEKYRIGRSMKKRKPTVTHKERILNLKTKIFKQRKGKRGLKNLEGVIIVPPNYDDFGFLPDLYINKRKSVIAIRDGKPVLVALDGSGKELTSYNYDDIRLADSKKKNSPYVYRKNGRLLWGVLDDSGHELCDNTIDDYICKRDSLWFESGELRGFWNYGKRSTFLPPIYDNIEIIGKPSDPLLFTLNGVQGYIELSEDNYRFIPMSDLEKMDEEDRRNTIKHCINEE